MTVLEKIEKEIEGLKISPQYILRTDDLESFFGLIIGKGAYHAVTRAFSLGYIRGQKALKAEQRHKGKEVLKCTRI